MRKYQCNRCGEIYINPVGRICTVTDFSQDGNICEGELIDITSIEDLGTELDSIDKINMEDI